ncbi:TrmH family RNA methyltransferase [Ramlibacter sp. PS4R-6]|uniref:TrmH family RNA methyltransferase n=1 Tax=Ramlibacter sp. PS4R-6 TaxID=3133438 RepID=UPI0030A72C30
MSAGPQLITSAANPLVKDLRQLAQESTAYRKLGRIWLEGDHLCGAALKRGVRPQLAVFPQSLWDEQSFRFSGEAERDVILPDALFATVSSLESPGHVGFVIEAPQRPPIDPQAPSVVLDRLQDPGNVGSILRSAAAFGFTQVIAMKGTAALWSAKVLRAGMGAHFALSLVEAVETHELDTLQVALITTSSHEGQLLQEAQLPWPCAWLLGHEGQGVDDNLAWRAKLSVRIAQPGGEESLNVAAAAAICLHASATAGRG